MDSGGNQEMERRKFLAAMGAALTVGAVLAAAPAVAQQKEIKWKLQSANPRARRTTFC